MMKKLAIFSLAVGCGGATTGAGSPDLAMTLPAGDGAATVDLSAKTGSSDLAGTRVIELPIGPIPLQPGQERTVCSTFRLPTTEAIDVVRIDGSLAPGSHHLLFYRSKAGSERKDIYNCQPLDTSGGDVPVFIAETEMMNAMPLPTGAAYLFEPGEMVRLEAHYLNASAKPIDGLGTIRITVGAPGNYQRADIMFCGSVLQLAQKGVPPGASSLSPGFWKPPAGIKVFGLTTHQHQRGSLMTVDKSTSTAPGQNLIMGKPYDNPPFLVWDDANLLTFGPDEGFRWQCHYQNNTNRTFRFGQSAENDEMCFFWAYYYPSVGRFLSMGDCWR